MRWRVSEAKQRFSIVVKSAASEPQLIFNRDRLVAAVVDGETLEECRICPVTIEIARCFGVLRGRVAARGQQHTQVDMLIAATAQLNQLTPVTRNIRDFEDCGVALLDPFS